MDIKLVNKEDYDKIYTFVEEAFKTAEVSDGTEQDFVLELRKSSNYIPELEIAAYDKNILIGHIMLTKQNLKSNKPVKAVLVAPLSVKKEYRSRGIGTLLMKYALNEAVKQGFNAAFLIGSPLYYKRFGFNETNSYNIKNISEVPDKFVLACELVPETFKNINAEIKIV